MRSTHILIAGAGALLAWPGVATAAALRIAAVTAYENYLARVDRAGNREPVFSPEQKLRARSGRIVVLDSRRAFDAPGALIHDWTGLTFVPGVGLRQVVALLRDFDRHAALYKEIIGSRLIESHPEVVRGRWRLRKKKGVTVVLDVDMEAHYREVSPLLWTIRSRSVRITEIAGAGTRKERAIPASKSRGFLWRLEARWWIRQSGDAVFLTCRTISMTRKAPTGLGWLITPMIRDAPRESLIGTLEGTRDGLTRQRPPSGSIAGR